MPPPRRAKKPSRPSSRRSARRFRPRKLPPRHCRRRSAKRGQAPASSRVSIARLRAPLSASSPPSSSCASASVQQPPVRASLRCRLRPTPLAQRPPKPTLMRQTPSLQACRPSVRKLKKRCRGSLPTMRTWRRSVPRPKSAQPSSAARAAIWNRASTRPAPSTPSLKRPSRTGLRT